MTYLDIDTPRLPSLLLMLRIQPTHNLRRVQPRILRQRTRNHFQRAGELLHGVLVQTLQGATILLDGLGKFEFRCTCSGNEAGVFNEGFDDVDTVVYGTFHIVQKVRRRSS